MHRAEAVLVVGCRSTPAGLPSSAVHGHERRASRRSSDSVPPRRPVSVTRHMAIVRPCAGRRGRSRWRWRHVGIQPLGGGAGAAAMP